MDESSQQERIGELFRESESEGSIERGAAFHVVLATLGPTKHSLLITLPAMCADLRSMRNLVGEIGISYAGNLDSEDVLQYADVVEWQQELLEGDDTKAGREFWRDYARKLDVGSWDSTLASFETKSGAAFAVESVVRIVPAPVLSRMKALCSAQNVAESDVLLACWGLFLSRMTAQPSLTIGCEFDGRKYAELEGALGLFSKYLPLAIAVRADVTFVELLGDVKNAVAEAHGWQESFAWSQVELPAGINALPTPGPAFAYADIPAGETHAGVKFSILRYQASNEQFRVKLAARRAGETLSLNFEYDRSKIDRQTVERWSESFDALLAAAVENPAQAASLLPLLSAAERRRLLIEWNQTVAEFPQDRCIHHLFETQAALWPERQALRCEQEQLTYNELNVQANKLAHALRRAGVGPNSLVGLCVDRGLGTIVSLLAVLKAGGAFVPLSADHPKARLAQQLAGAVALLTEQKFLAQMPETSLPVICLDSDRERWTSEPGTNLNAETTPENLAYVIYTSGSTGTPKGVAVRHRNLVNYAAFVTRRLQLDQHPQGLQFATVSTLSADLGNTCIYPSLISGGCLHVIPHDTAADSQKFRDYTARYPIDVLKIVPSHLAALVESGGGRDVLPRKYLITGGEALSHQLVDKIEALAPSCEVLNHYGPTETTVGSLTLWLKDFDRTKSAARTIPIGRPIANTRVYVLDAQRQPVPVGVAGELYISGAGVTQGYLNQPDRTAERFLRDPFVDYDGGLMYRTGDLVRYLPDGNIEFLGRVDDQVKIRGFRIELGEIESVLAAHPAVKQAVVLACADARGDKRLVAYIVGQRDSALGSDELRSFVKAQLPDYMVPSAIVFLPKLPLNANGKIDRQALPMPEDAAAAQKEFVEPRTPTEEVLAGIWAEVLRRGRIGVMDDFFDIGGHSLLATQVASRLREQFRVDVAVRMLFEAPTIAQLAKRIENLRREEQGLLPPPITRVSREEVLPLSYAQERLWLQDQLEPDNPQYNISRTWLLTGPLNVGAIDKALNEIVRRHESQRTTFRMKDGHPVQVIAPSLTIPLRIEDLSDLPEADRQSAAIEFSRVEGLKPFNLAEGPLVRAHLIRLAAEEHVLMLTMHHIISDAWSAGVFFQEFSALYDAYCHGMPSPLPDLTLQYADYAAHERSWLQGEVLEKHLAYWREKLKGAPPVLTLPADRPRPKDQSFRGSYELIPLSQETYKALKDFGRREGATLFMAALAGFQAMLSRYTGQDQIVIGTDIANRRTPETERMIGFFINLLPIRTDLSGNPTFRELLRRVREDVLEADAHQDVPFGKLVQDLQPERNLSHNPVVQTLFVMQNIPRAKRQLAGLEIGEFQVPVERSKFDLAVFMVEREEALAAYWLYSTDLFDKETIVRMARHFETLLTNALRDPDGRLSVIEMLTEEEKQNREAEQKQRKQSQRKKLMAVEPKTVALPGQE